MLPRKNRSSITNKMRVHFRCRGVGKGQKVVQKTLKAVPVLSPKYHSIEFQSVFVSKYTRSVGMAQETTSLRVRWYPMFYHVLSLSQTHARLAYCSSVLYGSLWEPAQSCRKLGKSICLRLSFEMRVKENLIKSQCFWMGSGCMMGMTRTIFEAAQKHPKATSSLQVLAMHLAYGFCPRWGHGDLVPRQKSGRNREILPLNAIDIINDDRYDDMMIQDVFMMSIQVEPIMTNQDVSNDEVSWLS